MLLRVNSMLRTDQVSLYTDHKQHSLSTRKGASLADLLYSASQIRDETCQDQDTLSGTMDSKESNQLPEQASVDRASCIEQPDRPSSNLTSDSSQEANNAVDMQHPCLENDTAASLLHNDNSPFTHTAQDNELERETDNQQIPTVQSNPEPGLPKAFLSTPLVSAHQRPLRRMNERLFPPSSPIAPAHEWDHSCASPGVTQNMFTIDTKRKSMSDDHESAHRTLGKSARKKDLVKKMKHAVKMRL